MSDSGYTLAEVLAALFIVGLATGGLVLTTSVLGRLQVKVGGAVATAHAARTAQVALEMALASGAPFRSQDPGRFRGEGDAFRFACGESACRAALLRDDEGLRMQLSGPAGEDRLVDLKATGEARFVYHSNKASHSEWPPSGESREVLQSVSILAGPQSREAPLVHARLWAEQPVDCAFDVVIQDCR